MTPTLPRCSLCPRLPYRKPIAPDGPIPCRVMLLGEAPHVDEDRHDCPFSGKTGQELNNVYLPVLGLPRSHVLIFNACACSQPSYDNPTPEQALACSSVHLGPLLAAAQPIILVPMGGIACSLFGDINLNYDHGIPRAGRWGNWTGCLFPTYHPSAALHATSYMIPLMDDFNQLGKLYRHLCDGSPLKNF